MTLASRWTELSVVIHLLPSSSRLGPAGSSLGDGDGGGGVLTAGCWHGPKFCVSGERTMPSRTVQCGIVHP